MLAKLARDMTSHASQSASARAGYLLINTIPTALAFPATKVRRITHAGDWTSETPIALSALLPIRFTEQGQEWVIQIDFGMRSLSALFRGKLRLEYISDDAILPMPALEQTSFGLFSNVVVANGSPSALVINVDVLFRSYQNQVTNHGN